MATERLTALISEGAIDTHVHVGDVRRKDGGVSRMWTSAELNGIGMPTVGKAHFLHFVPETEHVFGSTTLNAGLDPEHVFAVAAEMSKPFTVWFPSLNAKAHHDIVAGDQAWMNLFAEVSLGDPVSVVDDHGDLSTQTKETVQAIADAHAILATGHLSAAEVMQLVPYAITSGVRRVVLTHVSSRHNRLSPGEQLSLIQLGRAKGIPVFAEHCAVTWFDRKPDAYEFQRDFAAPIRQVGVGNCIVSSDCGRVVADASGLPVTPQQCLYEFGQLLLDHGITFEEIETLYVKNPGILLDTN